MATAKQSRNRIQYRSGLERVAAGALKRGNLNYDYEAIKIPFEVPVQKRYYLPDWFKDGIILEAKGRLTSQDRKKMLLVKEQHPEYTIIMIFGQPNNKLSKISKTTYAAWCEANGIGWIDIDDFEEDPERAIACQLRLIKPLKHGNLQTQPTKKKKPSSKLRRRLS